MPVFLNFAKFIEKPDFYTITVGTINRFINERDTFFAFFIYFIIALANGTPRINLID